MALNGTKAKVKWEYREEYLGPDKSNKIISRQDVLKISIDCEKLMDNIKYQFFYY